MTIERTIDLDISQRLEGDEAFRKGFFRSLSRNEIASQIVSLRKKRRMTQIDLAEAVSTHQSAISRLEKAEYESWNYQTLLSVAEALKARLRIHLEPIEDVIEQYENHSHLDAEELIDTTESVSAQPFSLLEKSQENFCYSLTEEPVIKYSDPIYSGVQ